MLPLMKSADKIFQINSNYKSSNDGYKFCNLDLNSTITPSDNRNMLISSASINIIEKMDSNQYSPFVRQKHCYYVDGQTIDNYSSELDATITAFLQKKNTKHDLLEETFSTLASKITENFSCDLKDITLDDL